MDASITSDTRIVSNGGKRGLDQVKQWISQCAAEHVTCQATTTDPSRDQWPSRLLAVAEQHNAYIKLCETSVLSMSTLQYANLSHCWGDFILLQLLTTNNSAFLNGISLDSLPKTFREAVLTTRFLGLSYLWIDSLCILQDSTEDWPAESNRMYATYRNLYVNLAAVASRNATGGLIYSTSLLSRIPCQVMVGEGEAAEAALTSYVSETQRNEGNLPLLGRAWAFQEILQPRRVLLFTKDEICWECNEMSRTQTYPNGEPVHKEGKQSEGIDRVVPFRRSWREPSEETLSSRFNLWSREIAQYSGKKLSKSEDKLVAVAGLVYDLGQMWPEADYLAGLWSFDLVHGLLWYTTHCTRPRFYHAPSWSWTSVDGRVSIHFHDKVEFCDTLVEVVEA